MKVKRSKFSYKLTEYVSPQVLKIYVIVLVSVLLLAILTSVGVSLYRMSTAKNDLSDEGLYSEEDISSILKSPGLTDFIIPESLESGERGFIMYREPLKVWSNELIENYIIPPEDLGIEKISEENKKIIEKKLEDVP